MLLVPVSWRCLKASGMAESSGQGVCKVVAVPGFVYTAFNIQKLVAATFNNAMLALCLYKMTTSIVKACLLSSLIDQHSI